MQGGGLVDGGGAPSAETIARVREALLAWYAANRRELPWRGDPDPYAVWVSEVMLQQTQVRAVVPYFERWMARFPNVQALAEAPLEDVLRCWAGLGYYARARHLHAAARQVVARHGGALPADPDALRALPGIGRYTAGAILSIAFGVAAPILDGNVMRVLSRLFLVEGDPKRGAAHRRLWDLAEMLVAGEQPGELNQALMELGATVCAPESPECALCPLAAGCRARAEGRAAGLPQLSPAPATVYQEHVSAVIRHDGRVLLAQRPEGALWAGLWEFPRAVRRSAEDLDACARRAAREAVGVAIAVGGRVAVVRHAVTRYRITLHAIAGHVVEGRPERAGCADWGWFEPDQAERLPLPAPQARILRAVQHGHSC
ncbi:MAG: A/G-specific adenine glycosylase [Armatimonadetes bacterium]|nr:A/G-specific adenine glycosylase [Armatimonadota bacterium]